MSASTADPDTDIVIQQEVALRCAKYKNDIDKYTTLLNKKIKEKQHEVKDKPEELAILLGFIKVSIDTLENMGATSHRLPPTQT